MSQSLLNFMAKPQTLTLMLPESEPAQIEEILSGFASVEGIHQRLTILFQAAQGACLLKLREEHGNPNGGGATSTRCGGESWEGYIKKKFGFSDEKARRLMQMWKGLEPRLGKLKPADRQRIGDLLRRPMILLPPAEVKILEALTHKLTDAKTQHDFLVECGFIKKPHGAGLHNKTTHALKDVTPSATPAPTPEGLIQDELWLPIKGGGDGTTSTIWKGIDDLYKAWNKKMPMGGKKVPLWQMMEREKQKALLTDLKKSRDVSVTKLDEMIAQLEESVS